MPRIVGQMLEVAAMSLELPFGWGASAASCGAAPERQEHVWFSPFSEELKKSSG